MDACPRGTASVTLLTGVVGLTLGLRPRRRRGRKFFCRHPACPRSIFPERLPGVVAPWARRTLRLAARLLALGLALGGAAGARLRQSCGLPGSRNPPWRVIHRAPYPASSPP